MKHKNNYSRNYQNYNIPRPKKTSRRVHGVDWQEFIGCIREIKKFPTPLMQLTAVSFHFLPDYCGMTEEEKDRAYGIITRILKWGLTKAETKGLIEEAVEIACNEEIRLPNGTLIFKNGKIGGESDA